MPAERSSASRGFVLSAAVAILSLAAISSASAQCVDPPQRGNWVNTDHSTRSITRAQLEFTCIDVVFPGQPRPPAWHVHLFGRCHPFDCDWGRVPATEAPRGVIHASYDQGFATRAVRIQSAAGGLISVRVSTHYRDGRRDNMTIDLMERAPF
jgi:hypothetical protein